MYELTASSTTTSILSLYNINSATNYQITNLSVKSSVAPSWTAGTGWLAGGTGGVATYGDVTNDAGLVQADGTMASVMAINTVYRCAFTANATPTTASLAIKNAAKDVVYLTQASYTDGAKVVYFTTPADVAGGGIGFVAYTAGDAFTLDGVSLKTVTLS